jgi:hypothetical protein
MDANFVYKEEHKLSVFENRAMSSTFEYKKDDVTGGRKKTSQ